LTSVALIAAKQVFEGHMDLAHSIGYNRDNVTKAILWGRDKHWSSRERESFLRVVYDGEGGLVEDGRRKRTRLRKRRAKEGER